MLRTGLIAIFDGLTSLCKLIGGASAVGLVLVLFANILARELFTFSIAWANEAAVALFVWMTFIGAGLCFAQNARIRFTMVQEALPARMGHVLQLIVTYVGAVLLIGFLATSIYAIWLYRNQVFATMPYSVSWQWAALPSGMLLASIGWIRHGVWWSPRKDVQDGNIAI